MSKKKGKKRQRKRKNQSTQKNQKRTKIYFIVEGHSEKKFFDSNEIKNWFRDQGFDVKTKNAKGGGNITGDKEISKHYDSFKDIADYIICLVDLENEYNDEDCSYKKAKRLIENNRLKNKSDFFLNVIIRMFEAWLLIDIKALKKFNSRNHNWGNTEIFTNPKEKLLDWINESSEVEAAQKLSKYFSFDRTYKIATGRYENSKGKKAQIINSSFVRFYEYLMKIKNV